MSDELNNPAPIPDTKTESVLRGISPLTTLIAILVVIGIAVAGAVWAPETVVVQIFGFCGVTIAALLNLLKQDYVVKRIDNNDKKTEAVRHAVDEMDKKVDTVVQQTNGSMARQFENIEKTVVQSKTEAVAEIKEAVAPIREAIHPLKEVVIPAVVEIKETIKK